MTQCPDPKGRVIFRIERTGKIHRESGRAPENDSVPETGKDESADSSGGDLKSLWIEVESVDGHCTSKMRPGDHFTLRGGRLYIPAGRHVCLYALQAALPLLPAKQRNLQAGDWLKDDSHVLCPDPAGNVILRIEPLE